jgi:hypothetical protein
VCHVIQSCFVPVIRVSLSAVEDRRFTVEARRRGLSLSEYLRRAGRALADRPDWRAFLSSNPPVALPADAPTDLASREGFGN